MRKFFILAWLCFSSSFLWGQVLNGDFESWSLSGCTDGPKDFPTLWTSVCNTTGIYASGLEQSGDAYSGDSAVALTPSMLGDTTPISSCSQITYRGMITTPPDTLFGWYKYTESQPGDMAAVYMWLINIDSTGNDTVSSAVFRLSAESSYTQFKLPFGAISGGVPNTILLTFASEELASGPGSIDCVRPGGTLWIDSLYVSLFQPPIGVQEALLHELQISPNPSTNRVRIACPQCTSFSSPEVSIVSLLGQEVMRQAYHPGKTATSLDLSSLSAGIYSLTLMDNGEIIGREKLIVTD